MKNTNKQKRFQRFMSDIFTHTPFVNMLLMLIVLWLLFSAGFYFAERGLQGAAANSYTEALYWGVAAFSTAGIANMPASGMAQLIGGVWIVLGSMLFFGTIVATVTGYFMKPMQRPHKKIIDTIEYNLEQLNELSVDELDLLRETIDTLINHVEGLKEMQALKASK